MFTATTAGTRHIILHAGFNYSLTFDDATASGLSFTVDGFLLQAGDSLVFDGSAEDRHGVETSPAARRRPADRRAVTETTVSGRRRERHRHGGTGFGRLLRGRLPDARTRWWAGRAWTDSRSAGPMRPDHHGRDGQRHRTDDHQRPVRRRLTLSDDFIAAGLSTDRHADHQRLQRHDIIVDCSAETDADSPSPAGSETLPSARRSGHTFDFPPSSGPNDQGPWTSRPATADDVILFDEKFTRDDESTAATASTAGAGGRLPVGVTSAAPPFRRRADRGRGRLDYALTVGDNNVTADGFTVSGEALLSGDTLTYDGGAESSADVVLLAGRGRQPHRPAGGSLLGAVRPGFAHRRGRGRHHRRGANGRAPSPGHGDRPADRRPGKTTFVFAGVAESTGPRRDWVDVIKPLKDDFDLDVIVTGSTPGERRDHVGTTFDFSLGAEIGAAELAAGHRWCSSPPRRPGRPLLPGRRRQRRSRPTRARGLRLRVRRGSHPDAVAIACSSSRSRAPSARRRGRLITHSARKFIMKDTAAPRTSSVRVWTPVWITRPSTNTQAAAKSSQSAWLWRPAGREGRRSSAARTGWPGCG